MDGQNNNPNNSDWQDDIYGLGLNTPVQGQNMANQSPNQSNYNTDFYGQNDYYNQPNIYQNQNNNYGQQPYNQQNQFNTNQQMNQQMNQQFNSYGQNPNNQFNGYNGYNPNMYNGQPQQQQPYQAPYQPVYMNPNNTPTPPVDKKPKKIRKKRKHKFLGFLLKTTATVLVIVGAVKLSNYLAEKDFEQFSTKYPFEFSDETNSMYYVTSNFKVPTEHVCDGKTYKVKWKSNDKSVKIDEDGNVTVYRPTTATRNVTLTQTYKKLLIGKAEKDYSINVIASDMLNIEDIDVITLDSIKDGTYNRDIDAVVTSDGNLDYLMGDFKGLCVNSVEDALMVIHKYREEFGVADGLEFKLEQVYGSDIYTTYKFNMYYNGIKVKDKLALVVTTVGNNEVIKLSIDNFDIPSNINYNAEVDYQKHANLIENKLIELDIQTKVEAIESATLLEHDGIIHEYIVHSEEPLLTYKALIKNEEVIEFEDMLDSFVYETELTGVNEKGQKLKFIGSYTDYVLEGRKYTLYDIKRNIHCARNNGDYTLLKYGSIWADSDKFWVSLGGKVVGTAGLLEMLASEYINSNIMSDTTDFGSDETIAVGTYVNLQRAYDFYANNFNLMSYDGKGTLLTIKTDHSLMSDNAAWDGFHKTFCVYEPAVFKYSMGAFPEVIGHEYTHAVFGEKITGSNNEVKGINEAYADIFGLLMTPEANWKICSTEFKESGKTIIGRDPSYIQNPNTFNKGVYPVKYKDEIWKEINGECHDISLMLSNIAFKMHSSGYFTDKDVAKIWYEALGLGFDDNSTFVTCRKNIIQTAETLKYSDAAIDFIAKCFDEADILDPTYMFKTTLNEENVKEAADGSKTYKTISTAVAGDLLLDDETAKRYLIAYSPADLVLGQGNVVVYEERKGVKGWEKDLGTADRLEDMINKAYPDLNIMGNEIQVEYMAVNPAAMKVAENFCKNSKSFIKNMSMDYMSRADMELTSEDTEWFNVVFDKLFGFIFRWEMTVATPYELCDNLGLLE